MVWAWFERVKVDLVWFARTKPELLWALVAGAVLVLVHVILMERLNRRLQAAARVTQRLERLSAAMNLLTDTVETGLAGLTAEVQSITRLAAPKASTRAATSKRIAAAAKRGKHVLDIARTEAISESEVRLHLALAAPAMTEAGVTSEPVRG